MLETPSIWWYSPVNVSPIFSGEYMGSDNPTSADNQQERLDAIEAQNDGADLLTRVGESP